MSDQVPHHITTFVSTALSQNKLSVLSRMLESFTGAVDAYGCILWQVTPGSKVNKENPSGYLFVLAEWFPEKKSDPMHDLPIARSITGEAVLSGKIKNIPDILNEKNAYTDDPFLVETGVRSLCSVPIRFLDGRWGAVNLYRNEKRPFDPDEVELIKQLAELVPALYKAIRDKVNFTVLRKIIKELNLAERIASKANEPPSKDEVKHVIQKICDLVANTFKCIETSIFLEDRLTTPGVYNLIATTWPDFIVKDKYRKDERDGITGWALKHSKHVKIFDLAHYERDRELIQHEYHGLDWKDWLDIKAAVRRERELNDDEALPPLSFMATPIVLGDEVLGAIRCSVAKEGPYYFADLALEILKLVAAQVSRYWSNWLSQREKHEEIRSWEALVKSVGEMNRFIHSELAKESPSEHYVLYKALEVTSAVIKGAEVIDVRLVDEKKHELYFAETYPVAYWNNGDAREVKERKERRFPLDEKSAGAYVFRTGRVHVMPNVDKDEHYAGTLKGIRRMIIAPIKVADRNFGVLDIRSTGESDFPPHAGAIAELLGQQLGLFYYLALTIRKLRDTETYLKKNVAELTRVEEQQLQIFADLKHQIYSPINTAHARLQQLREEFPEVAESPFMLKVRGLFGRTRRIAMNTALLENLARGKPLDVNPRRLYAGELRSMLFGSALNNKLMLNPKSNVDFDLERDSFNMLEAHEVNVDVNLLEHAIMNVMDNAFKYSYSQTNVQIFGGRTKNNHFYIALKNTGIEISDRDLKKCVERGWRGTGARMVTGEGSGIGLWIVDNIMRAHGGMLEIIPRHKEGQTEVRLFFPPTKK
jgi:signal transduction histidine kinase